MNEQDELTERIQILVSADAVWSSPEIYVPVGEVEIIDIAIPVTTAQQIIALAEADVARRLLSDKAKIAAAHHMQELAAQGVWDNRVHAYEGTKAALAAIGITVEETEK